MWHSEELLMSHLAILEEIARAAENLDPQQQQRVLAYIRSIQPRPAGKLPENLLRMAGTVPLNDCLQIEQAIKEGCGQVNLNAW
jgi:hypothetical protein